MKGPAARIAAGPFAIPVNSRPAKGHLAKGQPAKGQPAKG
jgi:hypothetical protein